MAGSYTPATAQSPRTPIAGFSDGQGTNAAFVDPWGIVLEPLNGNVFVTDSTANTVRQVTPWGLATTLAGNPSVPGGFADGQGTQVLFSQPAEIGYFQGVLTLADVNNNAIRQVRRGKGATARGVCCCAAVPLCPLHSAPSL